MSTINNTNNNCNCCHDWAEDDFGDAATAIQRIWRRMKEQREDPPTVKPSRFSNSALDDMNVWCHECAKCEGWFAPCEHDMVCYSDHMTNPDVKCDCKCPNGCHDEDSDEEDTSDDVTDADREEARWEALWEEE